MQQGAILFNHEAYVFYLNKIEETDNALTANHLFSYAPNIQFLYSGGASICALLHASAQINDCEISILAHIEPPNSASDFQHDLGNICEKLWLITTNLARQNHILVPENFILTFNLFATTPQSLVKFKSFNRDLTCTHFTLNSESKVPNIDSRYQEEDDYISALVAHGTIVIEKNEEIIFNSILENQSAPTL